MNPGSRRASYDADTARAALEMVSDGVNGLCAVLPILDALATSPRWTETEAQAMRAAGTVIQALADDVAHRARLLANHYDHH